MLESEFEKLFRTTDPENFGICSTLPIRRMLDFTIENLLRAADPENFEVCHSKSAPLADPECVKFCHWESAPHRRSRGWWNLPLKICSALPIRRMLEFTRKNLFRTADPENVGINKYATESM